MAPRRWLTIVAVILWALSAAASGMSTRPAWAGPERMDQRAGITALPTMAGRGEAAPYRRAQEAPRGNTPEGTIFADWVVATDPEHRYLLDAFVRDDRVLGVIVRPQRTRGQVQQMLTSLLSAMQRTFPDRPLEVIAYYRSGDQLARLHWDPHTQQAKIVWRR
jgi:hypothetical protein